MGEILPFLKLKIRKICFLIRLQILIIHELNKLNIKS